MRVWIDLANSPHVPLFEPVVRALRARGDDVLLTARDHAQTLGLARALWADEATPVGTASPPGRAAKILSIARRTEALRRHARRAGADVALSHGSYAQLAAARTAGIPAVTMMDYEHQPANHLAFRLAARVLVPDAFPPGALRRFGARPARVRRYRGYKEQLYLSDAPGPELALAQLGVDTAAVLVVLRPPPEGALYHRMGNTRFDELLEAAAAHPDTEVVVLPRSAEQRSRYAARHDVRVPADVVHGTSLLRAADLVIGAGGTMNREAALLGTPTYTLFAGELAAVDAALIVEGRLIDLRDVDATPPFVKKPPAGEAGREAQARVLGAVLAAVDELAAGTS
jgi:predicted glycosyltransferase